MYSRVKNIAAFITNTCTEFVILESMISFKHDKCHFVILFSAKIGGYGNEGRKCEVANLESCNAER